MNYYEFENKFRKAAIPNLNLYLTAFYAIGLIIQMVNPLFYFQYLVLDIEKLLHGQVWRILTFLFYPPTGTVRGAIDFLVGALIIYVYYSFSTTLLQIWNDFKFTLYILVGILGHVLGGILVYFLFKQNIVLTPNYLTFSIFIAFALSFPDATFLFMFLIPIKAKYLAYIELVLYLVVLITAPLSSKVCVVISLINVFGLIYIINKDSIQNFFKSRGH